jgi:hypothetical protein
MPKNGLNMSLFVYSSRVYCLPVYFYNAFGNRLEPWWTRVSTHILTWKITLWFRWFLLNWFHVKLTKKIFVKFLLVVERVFLFDLINIRLNRFLSFFGHEIIFKYNFLLKLFYCLIQGSNFINNFIWEICFCKNIGVLFV